MLHDNAKIWSLQGRNLFRRIIHKCVTCSKSKPIPSEQIMGSFLVERANPSVPFNNVGTDFCVSFLLYIKEEEGNSPQGILALFLMHFNKGSTSRISI